jgi:hypothetical protein
VLRFTVTVAGVTVTVTVKAPGHQRGSSESSLSGFTEREREIFIRNLNYP